MKDRYRFRILHVVGRGRRFSGRKIAGNRAAIKRMLAGPSPNYRKIRRTARIETAGQYRYWRGLFTVKEAAK